MIYTIKNQNLEIDISSHGAEMKAIRYQNVNYLHDANPKSWNRSAPLLFPNIGAIKDGSTTFNNKNYALMKHGFLRDRDFLVTNIETSSITLTYLASEQDLEIYPFNFQIDVTYQIHGNILKSYIVVKNLSSVIMPFNLGLHPAFKVPLFDNEKFEDYHFDFQETFSYQCPTVNLADGTIDFAKISRNFDNLKILPLNYDDYQNDALIFTNLASHQISLTNKDSSHGIFFEFYDFPMLGIWTPNHVKAPFICIEPWIGCADEIDSDHDFLKKRALINLKPDESKLIMYQIRFF